MKLKRTFTGLGLGLLVAVGPKLFAAENLPLVHGVETQPLLAQVKRLEDAMEFIGQPLSEKVREQLRQARQEKTINGIDVAIQTALDPLCVGTVVLETNGEVSFTPASPAPKLLEQGWRAFLVKVQNPGGRRDALLVDSPGARPLPESPAAEVAKRWIDVEMFDQRPLNATLSGLELEYRIIQIWAKFPGERSATLSFKASESGLSLDRVDEAYDKIWNFTTDTEGWLAKNECRFSITNGALQIESLGDDPFLQADLNMAPGPKVVRIRAKAHTEDTWQMFWMTEKRREADANHVVSFFATRSTDQWTEFKFNFTAEDHLIGLRLDPGMTTGFSDLESIEIANVGASGPGWAGAEMKFKIEPAIPVTFQVHDLAGLPTMAAFVIRDTQGRIYPMQSKRLEPDFYFQPQIYRADGETEPLPAGTYTVTCSRGPESVPEMQTLTVSPTHHTIFYNVQRWVDPMARGWFSGDDHIHASGCLHYLKPTEGVTPESMQRHTMGEDLKIGCSLNWGPGFDFQKQFFCGYVDRVSQYPYLIRQDVEVSGFGSSESGHLCLLRLKEERPPGGIWPTFGLNTLRWAKAQGAICGAAHSALGLEGSVGRVAGDDGPNGLPDYDIPRYDGIGANEFIVDVTQTVPGVDGKPVPAVDFIATMNTDRRLELNMWYQVLNCGFRPRASGETDFPCLSGARVGKGRVYVKLDGKITFDDWCDKLRDGRSYVTDGTSHLMEFTAAEIGATNNSVAVGEHGSELRLAKPGIIRLQVIAAERQLNTNAVALEVVVNGYPVASKMISSQGGEQEVSFEVPIEKSSWVALRTFPSAHTNPIFVLVDGQPIRASKRSAEWCLRGVDQCWISKEHAYLGGEKEQARAAYEHARQAYQQIFNEAKSD
jgi:hypothetical protein